MYVSIKTILSRVAEQLDSNAAEERKAQQAFQVLCLKLMGVPSDECGPCLKGDEDNREEVPKYIERFTQLLKVLDIEPECIWYTHQMNGYDTYIHDDGNGEWHEQRETWDDIARRGMTTERRDITQYIDRVREHLAETIPSSAIESELLVEIY
ncbi:MAG: hypothetical protein NTW66_04140 [Candidatus Magasanikbacteria bacterium]|nr:hypothetical protein [Candidatus Magasanikbacteria bacterium]